MDIGGIPMVWTTYSPFENICVFSRLHIQHPVAELGIESRKLLITHDNS
ncbi:hypothetical protein L483_21345 [Pseudomonas putida H8234]|nr:hypothetical protein L483_21345 [Pseudomonas putida H8234]